MGAAGLGRLVLLAPVWGLAFVFVRVALRGPGRWRKYLLVGLLNSAVPFTLIAFAQRELAASYTVILVSTGPLWAALLPFVALAPPPVAPSAR